MGRYYLMHKEIPVALMELDEQDCVAQPKRLIRNENASAHFPIGGRQNNMKFAEWWRDRAIPKSRQGAKSALQQLGFPSTANVMVANLGLSMNDCYWIRPQASDLTWSDVNLFEHDFTDAFGEYTFSQNDGADIQRNTMFTSAATQGEVQKKWIIDQSGTRCLVKGNYGNSYQQSLNEVFASELYNQIGFSNHLEYKLTPITLQGNRTGIGCISKNFCSSEVEAISAWELLQTVKIKQNESLFFPLKDVCLQTGMKEEQFHSFMDTQIMMDYLITNTDRHMNNISLLRNADTLEWIGFAPVYDNGNSMFYTYNVNELKAPIGKIETHSFVKWETDLLKYVSDRGAVDISRLKPDFTIYEKDSLEQQIRIPHLKERFERKREQLVLFQAGRNIWKTRTDIYLHTKG